MPAGRTVARSNRVKFLKASLMACINLLMTTHDQRERIEVVGYRTLYRNLASLCKRADVEIPTVQEVSKKRGSPEKNTDETPIESEESGIAQ